jgi:ankyrin repeat protein
VVGVGRFELPASCSQSRPFVAAAALPARSRSRSSAESQDCKAFGEFRCQSGVNSHPEDTPPAVWHRVFPLRRLAPSSADLERLAVRTHCKTEPVDRDEADYWIDHLPSLVRAAALGDAPEVASLLANGASVDEADEDGWSALHAAAARGHVAVVETLLTAGARVDAVTDDGFTPLLNASGPGTAEAVGALLAAGADVGWRDPRFGWTPLHRAAEYGRPEIVSLLIGAGANVNDRDGGGATALMAAAESGSRSTVERLLAAGADATAHAEGDTAVTLARRHGYREIAELIDGTH